MRVPTMSAGSRSGVNCRRVNVPPTTAASVSTARVLARPGTPSSRQWPRASRQTSRRSMARSWPTMTFLTSNSACSSSGGVGGCGPSRSGGRRAVGHGRLSWRSVRRDARRRSGASGRRRTATGRAVAAGRQRSELLGCAACGTVAPRAAAGGRGRGRPGRGGGPRPAPRGLCRRRRLRRRRGAREARAQRVRPGLPRPHHAGHRRARGLPPHPRPATPPEHRRPRS